MTCTFITSIQNLLISSVNKDNSKQSFNLLLLIDVVFIFIFSLTLIILSGLWGILGSKVRDIFYSRFNQTSIIVGILYVKNWKIYLIFFRVEQFCKTFGTQILRSIWVPNLLQNCSTRKECFIKTNFQKYMIPWVEHHDCW